MLKIGVIGAGHLGKIHIKLLKEITSCSLVGFYDNNANVQEKIATEFNITAYKTSEALINASDVIIIVTPTLYHFQYAAAAIRNGKHVFIEKPITHTLEEAEILVSMIEEAGLKCQVGHIERLNPAFTSIQKHIVKPMFIESHRLAQFNPRGTDVSVVLDLMIHDIDLVLSIVKSTVKRISANGVSIISDSPDIANARIEFDNGSVANLTSSRISMKDMRKMRLFQPNAYISIDFLKKESEIFSISESMPETNTALPIEFDNKKKYIQFNKPEIQPTNAIKMELELFIQAITENREPIVSITDGYNALKVAHQIVKKIGKNSMVI